VNNDRGVTTAGNWPTRSLVERDPNEGNLRISRNFPQNPSPDRATANPT
jgi:hypothetical protein